MKNVIKLLLLLVCLTLLASAVACNPQTNPSEPHYHKYVDGKCECGKADINYKPHEHKYVNGKCSCGVIDPNYEPPHEHVYVDGECECGATDPTYETPHEHVYVDGKCSCGATDSSYNALLASITTKIDTQRTALKTHKGKISKYNSSDPEILLFQQYTANIGNPSWGVPPTTPTADHPRLLINRSMIPEIRKSLEAGDKQAKAFQTLLASTITNDCILGAAYDHGTNPTVSTNNVHNLEYEYLEIIQAKALGYLAYDNAYYGYQAILYMKNFLKSLDIAKMASDQCRDYGYVMLTAAIV